MDEPLYRIPAGTDVFRFTMDGLANYRPGRAFTVDGITYDFWSRLNDDDRMPTIRSMIEFRRCTASAARGTARHRPEPPPTDRELDEWVRTGELPPPKATIPQQRRRT